MKVIYKNKKIERQCTDFKYSKKIFGEKMAIKIHQRIKALNGTNSFEYLLQLSVGRCHSLKGNRYGQFAMDLIHPYRLIFQKENEVIELIKILAIEDYH